MLKYLLGISLLYSMSFCFATEIKFDHESQIISIDGTSYTTAIISEPLSTTYELTDRHIILSNEYLASATSNTVVFYVFDKKSMLLNSVLSITFKPNEGVFVGWKIKQFNNIHINQIDNDLLDELNPPQGYDYQVTKTRDCRDIKYLLSEVTKSYKYCLNANNIYLDPTKGFFLPVFNFSKRLLEMERYSLEKPGLPSFLELQADENITNIAKSLLAKESQNFTFFKSIDFCDGSKINAFTQQEADDLYAKKIIAMNLNKKTNVVSLDKKYHKGSEKCIAKNLNIKIKTTKLKKTEQEWPFDEFIIINGDILLMAQDGYFFTFRSNSRLTKSDLSIKHYENSREGIRSQLITYHETMYIISVSEKSSTCLIKARVENDKAYFQPVKLIVEGDVDSNGSMTIKYQGENIVISNFSPPDYCGLFTDITGVYKLKYRNDFLLTEYFSSSSLNELVFIIKNKSYLYENNKKTKMYLIKGDKVTLLDEKNDDSGQKWYFINYKGKKDLNMWIKAEAVDLEPKVEKAELKPAEKPKAKKPVEITKQTLETAPSKNAEVIKAEKGEPIKTAKGSISLSLLASMFGLLSLRLKNIM